MSSMEEIKENRFEIIRKAYGLAIADIIKNNLRPTCFHCYDILIPSDAIDDTVNVNDRFIHIRTIINKQIIFGNSLNGEPLYTTIANTHIISVPLVKTLMSSFNESVARDNFSKNKDIIKEVEFMINDLDKKSSKEEIVWSYSPTLSTKKLPRGFIIA